MKKFIEKKTEGGFTLMNLLATLIILSILLVFGVPLLADSGIDCKDPDKRLGYWTRARVANAVGKLGEVNLKVQMFELSHDRYPTSMNELNLSDPNDPWGNPYVFLNHADVNGNGPKRKFHDAVPVNSYFDVYSMGPDGKTATPFTSMPGADDIVIANNGQYVGVACHYYE